MIDTPQTNSELPRSGQSWAGWPAGLFLAGLALMSVWQVVAWRAQLPWQAYRLNSVSFEGLRLAPPGWRVESRPVPVDPLEPNILACKWYRDGMDERQESPVMVRLAHGYNMPDCMRIKGFTVELATELQPAHDSRRQCWRLQSATGETSLWLTGVLSSVDFSSLDRDVRSLRFPKVGTPDDPHWELTGFSLASLQAPVENFRRFLRTKWNNARCDGLTFLKLRSPAGPSEEFLTLVASVDLGAGSSASPDQAWRTLEEAHAGMRDILTGWRGAVSSGGPR